MNKLRQTMYQKQTQNLLLKPKMLQSLEMLAMPILQLETHLKQELETNPMLEMQERKDEEDSEKERSEKEAEKEEIEGDAEDLELQRTLEESQELSEILDDWNEHYKDTSSRVQSEELPNYDQFVRAAEDKKRSFFDQLDKLDLTENEYDFAFDLIDSSNAHGYLPENFDLLNFSEEYGMEEQRANAIHQKILHLHPQGITARSIPECLLAQIEKNPTYPQIKTLVRNNFDDLIHKRYKQLASQYGVSVNTIILWKNQIAKLDPKPGLRILNTQTNYIVPDVIIKKIGNDFEVFSNDFSMPRIRMSYRYKKILQNVKNDRKAIDYVRGKINSAKFLIKSIYLRGRTLERVTKSIIRNQIDFFYESSGVLKPLTYSVIAEELQVNESTISRVVRTKYADTPFGIMCLKDFFTSTAGKDNNYNSVSRQSVELIVKRMIDAEDPKCPLSDQDIADKLREDGINVSRRVIAKYRKSLGILNSHLRKSV